GGDQVAAEPVPATPPVTLPEGARWAVDVVRCPVELRRAVAHALHGVVLVPDLAAAGRLVAAHPQLRAVTPDGDIVGGHSAVGGSAREPSYLEVQAAVEEAAGRRAEAEARLARLREELAAAREELAEAKHRVNAAAAAKREAEGQRNAAARRLAELGAAASSAAAEAQRLAAAREQATAARED